MRPSRTVARAHVQNHHVVVHQTQLLDRLLAIEQPTIVTQSDVAWLDVRFPRRGGSKCHDVVRATAGYLERRQCRPRLNDELHRQGNHEHDGWEVNEPLGQSANVES